MEKKNALLEAAAEILKGSQASAPKEDPKKLEGSDVKDLGGTTPQENVDAKLEPGTSKMEAPGKDAGADKKEEMHKAEGPKEIDPHAEGGAADADQASIKAKVEAAAKAHDLKEEKKEEVVTPAAETTVPTWKAQLSEDVKSILASEKDLPAEFAAKVGTIYEARVTDKVAQIEEQLKKEYEAKFAESVKQIQTELSEQVDTHLNYVVETWMKENELAIETGIRSELTEEFISGLQKLFTEHYIDIPSEKVDVVDELAAKVEELTGELNEQVGKNAELAKKLTEAKKEEVLKNVCEGLTQTQAEKIRTLVESVDFTAEGEYTQKVKTIRENYFPAEEPKKVDAKVLTEAQEPLQEEGKKAVSEDKGVEAVAKTISQYFR